VDAPALIARQQAATSAVSPAMLAVANLRHPDPQAKNVGSLTAGLLDTLPVSAKG
jgi:hypothetical protein